MVAIAEIANKNDIDVQPILQEVVDEVSAGPKEEPEQYHIVSLVRVLSELGFLPQARKILAESSLDPTHRDDALLIVTTHLGAAGRIKEGHRTARQIAAPRKRAEALASLAGHCAKELRANADSPGPDSD